MLILKLYLTLIPTAKFYIDITETLTMPNLEQQKVDLNYTFI